jgi:hypothetical protein
VLFPARTGHEKSYDPGYRYNTIFHCSETAEQELTAVPRI